MQVGTVKWFNDTAGYGFIEPADGGQDIFVHISAVPDSMPVTLEGVKVQFDVVPSRKPGRVQAANVELAP
jgi:CspA family cold shock protein